ncbi:hypothetical protein FACS1894123_06840 [Bacteroidia bacterium]|nr:hypothetical protein FACS1894123_06840 [Bacteroidia bacterium]
MKNVLKFQVKAFALMAILLISIVGTLSAQKIAIIDAGSSGSRLYVYDVNKNEGKISIVYPSTPEQKDNSKGRALSGVANHNDSVRVFLQTMTDKYDSGNNAEKIPLYVLATAGMRLVDEDKANSIYNMMHSQPREYNRFRLVTAMTISGRYEGLYAWIAANYKNGSLGFSTSTPEKPLTYTGITHGILEIGGASMQIAFAANEKCATCISRKGFAHIYSKSYLGGGVDKVYDEHKNENPPVFTEVPNPKDVSNLYGSDLKFIGLGRPIGTVLKEAKSNSNSVEDLKRYADSLPNNDSPVNFHPWINAQYIVWVVRSLNLGRKLSKPDKESDWTEGAALDILINNMPPEKFDYQNQN